MDVRTTRIGPVLGAAFEQRDPGTAHHCGRVRRLVVALARACGLPETDVPFLSVAAQFHDLGKIGLPDVSCSRPAR